MILIFKMFIFLSLLFFTSSQEGSSESLIVGIPSADTVPKGELHVTHESQFGAGPKWNSFNFLNVGLGERTEAGISLLNVGAPQSGNLVLASGIKFSEKIYENKKNGFLVKGTIGTNVPITLRGSGDIGNWTYAHTAITLPKTRTRITTGISAGTKEIFGRNTVGFIGGIEQPITKKFSFVMDWYSGTHELAALIPSIQYNMSPHDIVIAGIKIPNNSRSGDIAFVFEINKKIADFKKKKRARH